MKKRLHKIAVFAVLCICMLAVTLSSRADFGSYSGNSDYGGGGSDYSSDYGSSGLSVDYFSGDDDEDGGSPGTTVFVIVIIVVIIAISCAKKGKNGGSAPVRHTVSKPANLKPISEYTAIDEGFSEAEMKEKLSNLYIRM